MSLCNVHDKFSALRRFPTEYGCLALHGGAEYGVKTKKNRLKTVKLALYAYA